MNIEELDPILAEELEAQAPEHIWIQVSQHPEWTWCRHPIGDFDTLDVAYVRTSVILPLLKDLVDRLALDWQHDECMCVVYGEPCVYCRAMELVGRAEDVMEMLEGE